MYSQRDVLHRGSQYIHGGLVWKPVTVSDVCSWSGQQLEVDNTHTQCSVRTSKRLAVSFLGTVQVAAEAVDVCAVWSLELAVTALTAALEVRTLTRCTRRAESATRHHLTSLPDHVTPVAAP